MSEKGKSTHFTEWERGGEESLDRFRRLSFTLEDGDQLLITINNVNPAFSAALCRCLSPLVKFDPEEQKILSDAMELGRWERNEVVLRASVRTPKKDWKRYFSYKLYRLLHGHEPLQKLKVVRNPEKERV